VGAPSITQLHNGNVVVIWQEGAPNSAFSHPGLRGQVYSPQGSPIGNNFEDANIEYNDPQVAALNSGDFVIAYSYSSSGDILFSRFSFSGGLMTKSVVNTVATAGLQFEPAVA